MLAAAAPHEPLPPLYERWLAEHPHARAPVERHATCDSCAMCSPDAGAVRFEPSLKCCTFEPILPGFLVGAALRDGEAAEGRRRILERIAAGDDSVDPLGIRGARTYELLSRRASDAAFGRSEALACSWLDREAGQCTLWAHRNGVCATWFCKHERGATGQAHWRALKELLGYVERALAAWCVLELDAGAAAMEQARRVLMGAALSEPPLERHTLDRAPAPEAEALWGRWTDQRPAYFEACAELVGALSWSDVQRIGGVGVRLHEARLQRAHAALSQPLPQRIAVGACTLEPAGLQRVRLTTYSPYDPLEFPSALLEVLPFLQERRVDEARAALRAERGVELSDALLQQLLDYRLLVPAEDPGQGRG